MRRFKCVLSRSTRLVGRQFAKVGDVRRVDWPDKGQAAPRSAVPNMMTSGPVEFELTVSDRKWQTLLGDFWDRKPLQWHVAVGKTESRFIGYVQRLQHYGATGAIVSILPTRGVKTK